ncbi:MAG: insulinase family protein [Deltaproteobacteria bacterium]|nr:insulinase family protein [Deltaproteobacteria bacterium]
MSTQTKAFPFPTVETTLPNGLRVFVVTYDSPGLVAYYSVVRAGSRNEVEPGKSGFAHFFEHMMFRGTAKYPTDKYNAALKAMGADSNAFTSDDMTVYHTLAGTAALPTIVEIEADRFQNLEYGEAEFQKEARAVLGEYNKGASDPLQPMVEALYDNAFSTHTYKHTTIGFLRDIVDMPNQFAYSRQFFDRYYRPDNVLLLVVGDVTADRVLPLVEEHYGGWQPGPPRPSIPSEPAQTRGKRVVVPWKSASIPMLLVGYHAPAFSPSDIDSVALEVLAELAFAERGRLYQRLVLDEQKVEHIEGACERHVDPNLFTVLARVKRRKDMPHVEAAISEEIARIASEGTDEKTLAEVVAHTRYAFTGHLATADKVALVGAEFLALTGSLAAIDGTFALLSRVTVADVKRVAAKYFTPENRTAVVLEPEAQ